MLIKLHPISENRTSYTFEYTCKGKVKDKGTGLTSVSRLASRISDGWAGQDAQHIAQDLLRVCLRTGSNQ